MSVKEEEYGGVYSKRYTIIKVKDHKWKEDNENMIKILRKYQPYCKPRDEISKSMSKLNIN